MSVLSPSHFPHSFASPITNGHMSAAQVRYTPSIASGFSGTHAKLGLGLPSAKLPNDGLNLNPDDLFTKYTVSEVRGVQQRLRADAEAKQEELRLMVGERYRDLLQASSSIISIAKSSQHVLDALEESKRAILSQDELPLPPNTSAIDGIDDSHLFVLQVLSAHMKLLLDAPEYLWRLIERKKYLQAAWLFLLSRVVHRALVRQGETDEQSWTSEGIDVLSEFPLVQRQWELVSQFRSQIIHKSTLSLREITASTEDTCATLVTLHLLDSRPLNETLAALLLQRSKTMQSVLSWNPGSGSPRRNSSPSKATNGHAIDSVHLLSMREVMQVMKKALGTIAQTVSSARTIFQDQTTEPPLIIRVLQSIQEDTSELESRLNGLPDGLSISTQSLLTQLTSSANFQLLPRNLRSYKPYIDLNSYSTSLSHSEFSLRLQEWFRTSSSELERSATKWFCGLQSIKEVWTLRNSVRRCIATSGLEISEKSHITSSLDGLCHERIIEIWQKTLSNAESAFKKSLQDNISASQQKEPTKDTSPVDFLFQPPPIPILSQTVKSFVDTPFQKYQHSLKRQLVGRSVQLDVVLSTLEQCARTIQQDFLHLRTNADDQTKPLIERLVSAYQPAATAFSVNVVSAFDEASTNMIRHAESNTSGLVFLSRITDDLASSPLFTTNIGCSQDASQAFNHSLASINKTVVQKWRELLVTRVIREGKSLLKQPPQTIGPSSAILQALLSLCQSIRQLGIIYHPVSQQSIVQEVMRFFITSWFNDIWSQDTSDGYLHDIILLRYISDRYGESWSDVSLLLSEKVKSLVFDEGKVLELEVSAMEYLARTQTLFATLLPPPPTPAFHAPLLRFGTPTGGQTHQPAIDLAKPSPRFGMLLVGNVER